MKKFVDDGMFLQMEDHTYHLSEEEYVYSKNKWWLHSNKQGSNTMPLRNRSDFKQALSTLQRLQQEAGEEPHMPTYSYGIGKVPGGLLTSLE